MDEATVTMTQKDRTRLYVIKLLIDGKTTIRDAAEALNLSERQVKRLKVGVVKDGEGFVVHKNRGKKPVHTIPGETREQIIALAKDRYKGVNYTHFSELLGRPEGIVVSQPTVARILKAAGIKSPRKHKSAKPHRSRPRKEQEGLLAQMDASPFAWVANQKWSLHGAIDDATGKITGLYFFEEECLEGYFTITKQMICTCGIPVSIYADRHSIFQSPKNPKLSIEEELLGHNIAYTQFGRACQELGITLIPARSPQAKGRVERLWETLQDRLTIEMRLAGVTTIEEANLFLPVFINRFNKGFAVIPKQSEPAYRKAILPIDTILCRKVTRKLDGGSTFSYGGIKYQITSDGRVVPIAPRETVAVLCSPSFGIKAEHNGRIFNVREYEQPAKEVAKSGAAPKPRPSIPAKDHPWRSGLPIGPRYDKGSVACKALYDSTCSRL